jgi:NlpC/P60 family
LNLFKLKISLLIVFPIVFVIKCTTSSTIRYGESHENKEKRDSSVRFTSVDDSMIVDLNLDLKDPSDLPEEEPEVDLSSVVNIKDENANLSSNYTTLREKMLMEIIKYLDTPYKYGGTDRSGIDCSAFTQLLFKNVLSTNLERSARLQFNEGEVISDKNNLKFGDLVFFNTRHRVKPGHVGIYIGDNLFAHASSSKGVTISSLDLSYYASRFMGARRIENNGLNEIP